MVKEFDVTQWPVDNEDWQDKSTCFTSMVNRFVFSWKGGLCESPAVFDASACSGELICTALQMGWAHFAASD